MTIKNIIVKDNIFGKDYSKNHPNTKYSLDLILNEIIYVLKTGISWRNLRSVIKWQTLYWHFTRFVKRNIFKKLFNVLRKKYFKNNKSNIQIIDSSFITNKFGKNKISRNKFFKNKNCNKISILTDVNGIPLSTLIIKGSIHDIKFIEKHVNDCSFIYKYKNNKILADKAYESKKIRQNLSNKNCSLMIPKKKNSITNYIFDKNLYKKRIRVEHTFHLLKSYRKIMLRYDSLFRNYSAFVLLASSIIIYNKL